MRLLVDGDACPNKDEIKKIAKKYHVEMIVFIDYAHVLEDEYYQVVSCEIGSDSVDMEIIRQSVKGDLVITQDYGLAGLLLSKGVKVLHVSGKVINDENIDELLMSRYVSAKQRKGRHHLKGPAKRTNDVKMRFLDILDDLIKENCK